MVLLDIIPATNVKEEHVLSPLLSTMVKASIDYGWMSRIVRNCSLIIRGFYYELQPKTNELRAIIRKAKKYFDTLDSGKNFKE